MDFGIFYMDESILVYFNFLIVMIFKLYIKYSLLIFIEVKYVKVLKILENLWIVYFY